MTVGELIELLQQFPKETPVLVGARNAHTLNQPSIELYEDIKALVIRASQKEFRHSRVVDPVKTDLELGDKINKVIERGKA